MIINTELLKWQNLLTLFLIIAVALWAAKKFQIAHLNDA